PNVAMMEGFLTPDGYEPIYPRRYGEFLNAAQGFPRDAWRSVPEVRSITPKTAAVSAGHAITPGGWQTLPLMLPRATVFSTWVVVPDSQASWDRVAQPEWNAATTLLVEGAPAPPPSAAPGRNDSTEILES